MASPFSKTLTFLQTDDRAPFGRIAVAVFAIIVAWAAWLGWAQTTVYAVSEEGRLLAAGAASPVQTPVAGVVAESALVLGADVKAGDVLLRLDAHAELLSKAEEEARAEGLREVAASLSRIIDAERALADANRKAGETRVMSAAARAKVAARLAALSREEEAISRRLKAESLISNLEALKTGQDVQRQTGQLTISSADKAEASADVERAYREMDVRLLMLGKDLVEVRARLAASQAAVASLDWEIARRSIRASLDGKVADVAALPPGAAVAPGQTVATIVPQAPLRWVATFSPREVVGRIHPGQTARIRLDAFPWTAYGALRATVVSVGSEPRERRVRVEFALVDDNPDIPLSHGMTGVTDV